MLLTAATAEPEVARWMIALAVVGAINAAIAAGYYLRVVSVMYFREAEQPVEARGGRGAHAVALICAGLLVVVGCMPSGLVEQSRRARPAAIRAAGAERTASTTHDAVRREGARTHLFRLSAKPER